MISEVQEFVYHVIMSVHRVGILSNILRELSVVIIVQQEGETSPELTHCELLLEVVNVDLIAECALHYFLSECRADGKFKVVVSHSQQAHVSSELTEGNES